MNAITPAELLVAAVWVSAAATGLPGSSRASKQRTRWRGAWRRTCIKWKDARTGQEQEKRSLTPAMPPLQPSGSHENRNSTHEQQKDGITEAQGRKPAKHFKMKKQNYFEARKRSDQELSKESECLLMRQLQAQGCCRMKHIQL